MKRKEVYNAMVRYAEESAKKFPGFDNKKIMGAALKRSNYKNVALIDSAFNGVYNSYKFNKFELGALVGIVIASLFIPIKFIYRPLIGLGVCIVVEFIRTKGHKFLVSEVASKMVFGDEVKVCFKPKMGSYTGVYIGTNPDDLIEVHDLKLDEDLDHLSNGVYQYADKETLNYFIERYLHGDKTDIDSVSKGIRTNLMSEYAVIEHILNENPKALNSFKRK